ncbi:hypothetical protein FOZ61_004081 [Perkinsus olseni]|uniref:Uncharacterized protein n=1 Tax=Perkinsus olseni TaxID=32597 RepID=A0A7J6LM44_PEROL|nr:hypothetical protein FOZ61_004081 [Perkinsus olseni]
MVGARNCILTLSVYAYLQYSPSLLQVAPPILSLSRDRCGSGLCICCLRDEAQQERVPRFIVVDNVSHVAHRSTVTGCTLSRSMRAARPHGLSIDSDISASPVVPDAGVVEAEGMERTRRNLVVLVGLEALAAFITVVWDIVLILAARKEDAETAAGEEVVKSCEHFLAHAPWAETAVFILTRGFSLLVPQLAVLYVFYWVNRRLHASFRYNWDIDLAMGDTVCLPPAPTPFAAGTLGEPSFWFGNETAASSYNPEDRKGSRPEPVE